MPAQPNNQIHTSSSDELTLKDLLYKLKQLYNYLLTKWILISVIGILGAILGLGFAYSKQPVYTATTSFVLESNEGDSGFSQYAGIASMVGVDLAGRGGGIFQEDNIVALYKSRSMLQKTLLTSISYQGEKSNLAEVYISINKLREAWAEQNSTLSKVSLVDYNPTLDERKDRLKDSLLSSFVNDINKNYLEVGKLDKKLNIISVSVKSKNEFFAKTFNEQLVENVNEFFIQTKTRKSLDNVSILSKKVDSVRAAMNGAIYRVAEISDATPNLNPTRQIQRTVPIQRSQFSAETNKEILGQLIKNLEMSKISLLKETPLIQVVDQPIYPLAVNTYGKVKSGIIGFMVFSFLITLFLAARKFIQYLVR